MKKYAYPYTSFITNHIEGCLMLVNNEIVLVKKVKTFKWSALVIYSLARNPKKIRIAKLSLDEPFLFYYNPNMP